eukprot:7711730-Pyramimonas_sp.AAC.1
MAAENKAELAALAPDLQRQHAHFAHSRTWSPADKPPGDSTRKLLETPRAGAPGRRSRGTPAGLGRN